MSKLIDKLKLNEKTNIKLTLIFVVSFFALMFALFPFMATVALTKIIFVDYLINTSIAFACLLFYNYISFSTASALLNGQLNIKYFFAIKYSVSSIFLILFGLVGLLSLVNTWVFIVFGVIFFVVFTFLTNRITLSCLKIEKDGIFFNKTMTAYTVGLILIILTLFAIV